MVKLYTEEASFEAQIFKDFKTWARGIDTILDEPILVNEHCRISKKLKNGRKGLRSGPLSNEFIKLSVEVLPSHFVKSFNVVLFEDVFPESWSRGLLILYNT